VAALHLNGLEDTRFNQTKLYELCGDDCMDPLLHHWTEEFEQRLTADMARTGLSLGQLVLGILYGWTTRRWTL
jgi:hypothetical protein